MAVIENKTATINPLSDHPCRDLNSSNYTGHIKYRLSTTSRDCGGA